MMMTRSSFKASVYFCLLTFFILLAACQPQAANNQLTPTDNFTETPAALPSSTIDWFPRTATPTFRSSISTATPDLGQVPSKTGKIIFTDDFSDNTIWQTGNDRNGSIAIASQSLTLAVSAEKAYLTSLSTHKLPANFFLEFTIDVSLCSSGDQYGIIFWRNSNLGTFRLWANCQGELKLERLMGDSISIIQNWMVARRFLPDSPSKNVFGIQAKNGVLDFFVNDVYQFSWETQKDLQGGLGVIAHSGGKRAETIIFSNLIVMEL